MPNRKGYRSLKQKIATSQYQEYKVAKALVEAGSKVNTQDNFGNSPLHHALCADELNYRLIRYLISVGADLDLKNKFGVMPKDVMAVRKIDLKQIVA